MGRVPRAGLSSDTQPTLNALRHLPADAARAAGSCALRRPQQGPGLLQRRDQVRGARHRSRHQRRGRALVVQRLPQGGARHVRERTRPLLVPARQGVPGRRRRRLGGACASPRGAEGPSDGSLPRNAAPLRVAAAAVPAEERRARPQGRDGSSCRGGPRPGGSSRGSRRAGPCPWASTRCCSAAAAAQKERELRAALLPGRQLRAKRAVLLGHDVLRARQLREGRRGPGAGTTAANITSHNFARKDGNGDPCLCGWRGDRGTRVHGHELGQHT